MKFLKLIFFLSILLFVMGCNESPYLNSEEFVQIPIVGGHQETPCIAGPNCTEPREQSTDTTEENLHLLSTDCFQDEYVSRVSFAALLSNYSSVTSVSLLDQCGKPVPCLNDIIHSNLQSLSRRGVSAAIGGDVVLPSMPFGKGRLAVIDRGTNVITEFDLADGSIIQTVGYSTDIAANQAPSVNAHDALPLSSNTYLITRHDPSGAESCAIRGIGCKHGNDLVMVTLRNQEIDAEVFQHSLVPISLNDLNVLKEVERYGENGIETTAVAVFPRPSRLLYLKGPQVFISGLAFLDGSFSIAQPGSFAMFWWHWKNQDWQKQLIEIQDPGDLQVTRLANCGNVVPVQRDTTSFLIQCGGEVSPFSSIRRSKAGIVKVQIEKEISSNQSFKVMVKGTWYARNHSEVLPPYTDGVTSLGGPHVVVPANPNFNYGRNQISDPDQLLYINLETGHTEIIFIVDSYNSDIPNFFALRSTMYNPHTHVLLVADATRGIHRFQVHWENDFPSFEYLETVQNDELSRINQGVQSSHSIAVRQIANISPFLIEDGFCL